MRGHQGPLLGDTRTLGCTWWDLAWALVQGDQGVMAGRTMVTTTILAMLLTTTAALPATTQVGHWNTLASFPARIIKAGWQAGRLVLLNIVLMLFL